MSWSVEGRMYHNYDEYCRARDRYEAKRLERLVQNVVIPAADTASTRSRLADAQVRLAALDRLTERVRSDSADLGRGSTGQRDRTAAEFAEVAEVERQMRATLERAYQELAAQVAVLEKENKEQESRTRLELDQEVQRDRTDERRLAATKQRFLAEAAAILQKLDLARLGELGLESHSLKSSLAEADSVGGQAGFELARRTLDQARELDQEFQARESRLRARAATFRAELAELRASLEFTPEDRRDLVGEGSKALDAPLQHELTSLEERLASIKRYEDHEHRYQSLYQRLASLESRTVELATQVKDYERLDEAREKLILQRLADQLGEMLGEPVERQEVRQGELGLQPVEARFVARSGEIVDCTVAIDGSLRLHHHGHSDQASCARAARRLAEVIPSLMATEASPRLDVADRHAAEAPKSPGSAADNVMDKQKS